MVYLKEEKTYELNDLTKRRKFSWSTRPYMTGSKTLTWQNDFYSSSKDNFKIKKETHIKRTSPSSYVFGLDVPSQCDFLLLNEGYHYMFQVKNHLKRM